MSKTGRKPTNRAARNFLASTFVMGLTGTGSHFATPELLEGDYVQTWQPPDDVLTDYIKVGY